MVCLLVYSKYFDLKVSFVVHLIFSLKGLAFCADFVSSPGVHVNFFWEHLVQSIYMQSDFLNDLICFDLK